MWDATISFRPLCEETRALTILSAAGRAAFANRWNAPIENTISEEDLEFLRVRMANIIEANPFYAAPEDETIQEIWCASDASNEGHGHVVWKDKVVDTSRSALARIDFPTELKRSHIFIKEMFGAARCLEDALSGITKARVWLAVDNTAVYWSIINGYSHNHHANALIQRIYSLLHRTSSILCMAAVPSACNAADCPSRNKPFDFIVEKECLNIIQDFRLGKGRGAMQNSFGPAQADGLRHEEPPDDDVFQPDILGELYNDDEREFHSVEGGGLAPWNRV